MFEAKIIENLKQVSKMLDLIKLEQTKSKKQISEKKRSNQNF